MRTLTKDLSSQVGSKVTLQGWLHKKRLLGGLTFINIRDRSGLAQIVIEDKNEVEKLRGLQVGTVLSVQGKVVEEARAPGGAEIHDAKVEVLVKVEEEPTIEIDKPISHRPENLDTLFDNRVLALRNLQEQTIFRVQAKVLQSVRKYFAENDFVEMNTPKLLAEATEGGAEVFKLEYFGKTATLAQSAQFYKQIMVGVFERVFETNPTYRAEPSATTRHMTEFITIDAEMSFIEFEELLDFTGGLLHRVVDDVFDQFAEELKKWNSNKPLLAKKIPRISMQEVHQLYSKAHDIDTTTEDDLRPDEEKWICEYAKEKYSSEAVFVHQWPISSMKFYHRKNADDPQIVDRADLLFRGVEIATVPMREHRYDVLVQQLQEIAKGDPNNPGFKHYLEAFRFGLPTHGGFGLGLERTVEKLLDLNNVKEATLFPRDMNRLAP